MNVSCREFVFDSADYHQSIQLRDEILRKPLGLTWEKGVFEGEEKSFHLGAFSSGRMIGSLVLKPLDPNTVKMRQVAISLDFQRAGVGTALVAFAEEFAAAAGYREMVANARESAVPFYTRLGYTRHDPLFMEVGIPHYLITKPLSAA